MVRLKFETDIDVANTLTNEFDNIFRLVKFFYFNVTICLLVNRQFNLIFLSGISCLCLEI